ncbi:hypothetical protein C8Q80DRAFT_1271392 [Daedaleopsis nitida]|nr:hypothetical protein C8Q80DRAFT_1271392 [Daedaleopsis nitida]
MNRRRKGGNASAKPPALTKPPATTPAPLATINATPARVSPPLKAPSPPQNVPPPPKAAPQPARTTVQAPRPSVSHPKPLVPSASAMKTAHPTMPGPSQRRVFTRADRVRAQWMDFEETWVRPRQVEVEQQLSILIETAEKNSRVKGRALEQNRDRIVNSVRREFAMAAIAEWEKRLDKAGLQAEDWSDMTPEEMFVVEQVLSWEDTDEDTGVFALSQRDPVAPTLSGKTAVESSPPMAPQHVSARTAQTAPSPAASSQYTKPAPQQQQPSSWASWFTRGVTVTEVPEQPAAKPAASTPWGAKNVPIIEDLRTSLKATPAPQPPLQTIQPTSRPAQPATKTPQPAPATPPHGLLAYAVPISLKMPPVEGVAASDPEFVVLLDKLYVNSIRQFHMKASDYDAELARQLRRPMPASEREWTVRAHMMMMEQMARDIVERRDTLANEERRKRGFGGGGGGGDSAPMTAKAQIPQPPGAFPDEHIRISPGLVPAQDPEPEEPEPEREPESDVDEVIEIPVKGKKGKKGKKAAEGKPALNGRSTPIPVPAAAAKAAAPTTKATPVVEKKPAPATTSGWGAKTALPARSASPAPPAPINTKLTSSPAVNGRSTPAPAANGRSTPAPDSMSLWEAAQTGKLSSSSGTSTTKGPETKPPSPPNGMWAPPIAHATSSKNSYAPSRPSRLARVSEPESPEPPSPPPTREPTGKDYVAWFAGSSSEDEAGLSEDEDADEDEDEDEAAPAPSSSFSGGLLASLAGASPWALFGDEQQQKERERGRTASPARGRGASATPAPAMAAAGRFAVGADLSMGNMGMGMGMGTGGEWARWGAGPSSFGAGPSAGYGAGPSGAGAGRQWKSEEDSLEDMLTLASKTLDRAATTTTQVGRGGAGVNIEEAMAMYVTAQKARETLATPVGGRSASAWRR